MTFDPTLSIGALLNLLGFVLGGLIFAVTLRSDLRALVSRVDRLEIHSDRMDRSLQALAVQDERLNSHAARISKLEDRIHG